MQDRKEQAKAEVARLVERYQRLTPAQRREYDEANTKTGFIEPLFRALGWVIEDKEEVTLEEPVSNRRVDYAFKVRGVPRFYVEAKRLTADLTDVNAVKQAITYAYNKGVTWAVLTNFSEVHIFNANLDTDYHGARLLRLSSNSYSADFEWLWALSKDGITLDLLDKLADKLGSTPTRIPVEKRLYSQLRDWREQIFKDTSQWERHLNGQEIDEIVQRLFNRLIFMRTCEDRELNPHELRSALHRYDEHSLGQPLLEELRRLFRQYFADYDSDLFAPHLTDKTQFDDPLLGRILKGLHTVPGAFADYDFSLIDADILGAMYEQYLGYIAQEVRTSAHNTSRTGLTGRRKEQGIYYTPLWVTSYIMHQTLGKFIQEHEDQPDAIYDLKILDMSCGSGSFLIRAYDQLLRWQETLAGKQLTQEFRVPLLKNSIFGVDLDPLAVEIARLNLLLRAVTDKGLLPFLSDNVIQGNSLIHGTPNALGDFFGEGWEDKHAIDWDHRFPKPMQAGGFDIIVGNPPYVRIQTQDRREADYFRANYESAKGSFDISVLFIERGLKLLKPGGRLGFITSGKFLKSQYGEQLLHFIQENALVETVVDVSEHQVFGDATTYPVIIVLQNAKGVASLTYKRLPSTEQVETLRAEDVDALTALTVPQETIVKGVWPPPAGMSKVLIEKMNLCSLPLGDLSQNVFQGLITSADKVYHLRKGKESTPGVLQVYSESLGKEVELEAALLKPLLSGKQVKRYTVSNVDTLLLFPYQVTDGVATLIPAQEFASRYPLAWEYLNLNKATLENREQGKMRHERWYAYGRTQSLGLHDYPKLAVPRLVHRLECFYDGEGSYYLDNVDVGGVLLKDGSHKNYLYVLGLLNSRLLDWQFQQISAPFRGGFRSANRQFLEPLPIRRIDFGNATDKAMHDGLVALVERMLALQERARPVRGTGLSEEQDVQREIARTDAEIDALVYELYGLTEAERRLVEGETER